MMTMTDLALAGQATLAASAAIVFVAVLRSRLRALFGSRIAYAFWLIVPLAMIASVLPSDVQILSASAPESPAYALPGQIAAAEQLVPSDTPGPLLPANEEQGSVAKLMATAVPLLFLVWFVGFAASLLMQMIGHLRFVRHNRLAARSGRVCRAAGDTVGPSLIGLFKPYMVVPKNFSRSFTRLERSLIFAHERAHLRAGDVPMNGFALLLRSLFWFNPLAYAAYHMFRMDQELACDERVMARHGQHRRLYAETLLKSQMAAQTSPFACAWLPMGVHPLKERVARLSPRQLTSARRGAGVAVLLAAIGLSSSVAWATLSSHTVEFDLHAAMQDRDGDERERENDRLDDSDDPGDSDDLGEAQGAALVNALLDRRDRHARALIRAGADVNFKLRGDGTPLIIAARRGDMDMLQLLVDRGADTGGYVPGDGTPLVAAVRRDNMRSARFLINAGADVNQAAPGDGNPLIQAARRGSLDMVKMLVEAGADVNGFVLGDETPLIGAARMNRINIARYLIDKGADVNLKVRTGHQWPRSRYRSPLGQAELKDNDRMADLLREAGAVPVTDRED